MGSSACASTDCWAFGRTIDFPERFNEAIAALGEELAKAGVTTIYTLETPELLGAHPELPLKDVSASAHNIIRLRHVELGARVFRLISVLKMRDSNYDSHVYEFRIEEKGLAVADTLRSAAQILTGTVIPETAPPKRATARRKKGRTKAGR